MRGIGRRTLPAYRAGFRRPDSEGELAYQQPWKLLHQSRCGSVTLRLAALPLLVSLACSQPVSPSILSRLGGDTENPTEWTIVHYDRERKKRLHICCIPLVDSAVHGQNGPIHGWKAYPWIKGSFHGSFHSSHRR